METPMSTDLLAGHFALLAELIKSGLRQLQIDRKVIDRKYGIRLLFWHAIDSACKMGGGRTAPVGPMRRLEAISQLMAIGVNTLS